MEVIVWNAFAKLGQMGESRPRSKDGFARILSAHAPARRGRT